MHILDSTTTKQVFGGTNYLSCYEAYETVANDSNSVSSGFLTVLFSIILTPLWTIGYVMGKDSAVRAICGSDSAYNHAKLSYCQFHPSEAQCKPNH